MLIMFYAILLVAASTPIMFAVILSEFALKLSIASEIALEFILKPKVLIPINSEF